MEEIDEISYHSGSLEDGEGTQDEPFTPLPEQETQDKTYDMTQDEQPEGSIAPT